MKVVGRILLVLIVLAVVAAQVSIDLAYFGYGPMLIPGRDTGSRDYVVQSQGDQDLLVETIANHGPRIIGMDDSEEHRNVFFDDGTGVIWFKKPQPKALRAVTAAMTLVDPNPPAAAAKFAENLKKGGHKDAKPVDDPVKSFEKGVLSLVVSPSFGKTNSVGFRKHFLKLPQPKPYAPGK